MPKTNFVHLHCHSEYTVKSSIVRIPKLIELCKKTGMTSVALTDDTNLFAAIKFYQAAKKADIKPIFGAEMTVRDGKNRYQVLLYCQDQSGFLNLSELISKAYLEGQSIAGVSVSTEQIIAHQKGLIMIAPPITSDVAVKLLAAKPDEATQKAQFWDKVFKQRFYLAVQRTGRENDEQHLHLCVELGIKLGIPLVATNNVQFLHKTDFDAFEARVCIAGGGLIDDERREKHDSPEQYLKTPTQMAELFADFPELLINSCEFSKRCNVHFELYKKNYLPIFPIPQGLKIADFLTSEAEAGLEKRLSGLKIDRKIYDNRLKFELGVITKMDFPGYFLIVADFIRWSRENDIPVGPGRGSGAGSLVAYALKITNVDPIKHDLLFERFLNPERVSMPDFDIDFCTERRDEVIEYVSQKYGSEKVSQIITYGSMAAKGVVRDVGRVLQYSYNFCDGISKLIPNDLKINLSRALGRFDESDSKEMRAKWFSEELKDRYDADERVTTLIDLSLQLEGLVRNVGTHAGGVLIAPSKISDFCPIYKGDSDSDGVISQFDMKDVDATGLVKFDFLGLSNLTVIDKTLKTIDAKGLSASAIDLDKLPLDNKKVYELLQKCDVTGVFQLESGGMRAYLKKLKADSFEDIVAILALYRPGPLDAGMVDDYINVKHGASVKYPHPMLEGILKPTNGVFLYQEQVMESARVLAGYSLGGADLLRRAMGKKIKKEMAEQRDVFVKGCGENSINDKKANQIFDLIDKFSGYGFNKSHSVAYAYISYQTAWLKANFPAAFMASVLSGVADDTDRVAFVVGEVEKMGIKIKPPNIQTSNFEFTIDNDDIIYGLGAIKGVGKALVSIFVNEREKNGNYQDIFDFCMRIERRTINKTAIEALIYSGAFDIFGVERSVLIATYPTAIRQAEQKQVDILNGQSALFGDADTSCYQCDYVDATPFSFKQRLKFENTVLGYYFYQHPTDEFADDLSHFNASLPSATTFRRNKEVRILALISVVFFKTTKNGSQMANLIVEDGKTKLRATIFAKNLDEVRELLKANEVRLLIGKISKDFRDEWQLIIDDITDVNTAKSQYAKRFEVILDSSKQAQFAALNLLLKNHQGSTPVQLIYHQKNHQATINLPQQIKATPTLTQEINTLLKTPASKIYY